MTWASNPGSEGEADGESHGHEKGEGRREKGEGRREKGEGRREKGEGRREKGEGSS
jgi:hypothetical protein